MSTIPEPATTHPGTGAGAIPDFAEIELGPLPGDPVDVPAWAEAVQARTGRDPDALVWDSPEGIAVKPLYTAADRRRPRLPATPTRASPRTCGARTRRCT